MKKLLFLVPLLLAGLSTMSLSLYKDNVDLKINKNQNTNYNLDNIMQAINDLSPGHWKLIDYSYSGSTSLEDFSFGSSTAEAPRPLASEPPKIEPLHQGAKFRGFPFAAYFSKSSTSKAPGSTLKTTASGYSWLWGAVNIFLIISSLVIAIKANRKKISPPTLEQPFAPQRP